MFSDLTGLVPDLSVITNLVPEVNLFDENQSEAVQQPKDDVQESLSSSGEPPTLAGIQAQQAHNKRIKQQIGELELEIERVQNMAETSDALDSIHRAELAAERAKTAVVVASARKEALAQQIDSVKGCSKAVEVAQLADEVDKRCNELQQELTRRKALLAERERQARLKEAEVEKTKELKAELLSLEMARSNQLKVHSEEHYQLSLQAEAAAKRASFFEKQAKSAQKELADAMDAVSRGHVQWEGLKEF